MTPSPCLLHPWQALHWLPRSLIARWEDSKQAFGRHLEPGKVRSDQQGVNPDGVEVIFNIIKCYQYVIGYSAYW